ncbi:hypothetical protein [Streptomyces sp. WM6378]|uniref:hypothetical protein n=1 Tax=Streptomyces sp. WM6378 TaxID=1415557 RepID=UPI0006ADDFE3|nr:hypothetical protein [Streptomyces sp. WM6378]KOU53549.1 hypothetical protein ADK54_04155 [Streptomyces sp. WM6378]
MSALNVDFDDEELEAIREMARERGLTMKAFVRSSTTDAIAQHRALKEAAAEFQRVFHDSALADAIAAAGLDDGPAGHRSGQAA